MTQQIAERLKDLKVGDLVQRRLGGGLPMMEMVIVGERDGLWVCDGATQPLASWSQEVGLPVSEAPDLWTFDKATGMEVDEGLRWGPQYGVTGTYIVPSGGAN